MVLPDDVGEVVRTQLVGKRPWRRAIVVLPQPGGPHRISDASFLAASIRPSGPSGPSR